jgi:octaprenyl-diphosphate synthase
LSSPGVINAKRIFDLVREDLAAIERQFSRETQSNVRVITEIGEYLRAGGGKRIRPLLLLLASKLFANTSNGLNTSAVRLGSVVEIIHTATLVHDDIIDEADIRRGRPAANTQWGNSKCVLAGDWLYMQAFKVALQERNFRVLDVLIDLTQQMVEGELLQTELLGRCASIDEYLDLIFRKTACLFSVCMRLGAIVGKASPEQEEQLGSYGYNLGMAFQIVDDVLDLTASEEVLGKPVGSDLREGKTTLAVIAALEKCTAPERAQIETVLREHAFHSITHQQILDIIHRYDGVAAAMARASEFAAAATRAVCSFPESEIKQALLWMPEFVIARNS